MPSTTKLFHLLTSNSVSALEVHSQNCESLCRMKECLPWCFLYQTAIYFNDIRVNSSNRPLADGLATWRKVFAGKIGLEEQNCKYTAWCSKEQLDLLRVVSIIRPDNVGELKELSRKFADIACSWKDSAIALEGNCGSRDVQRSSLFWKFIISTGIYVAAKFTAAVFLRRLPLGLLRLRLPLAPAHRGCMSSASSCQVASVSTDYSQKISTTRGCSTYSLLVPSFFDKL